jgi:hypothetical protein
VRRGSGRPAAPLQRKAAKDRTGQRPRVWSAGRPCRHPLPRRCVWYGAVDKWRRGLRATKPRTLTRRLRLLVIVKRCPEHSTALPPEDVRFLDLARRFDWLDRRAPPRKKPSPSSSQSSLGGIESAWHSWVVASTIPAARSTAVHSG